MADEAEAARLKEERRAKRRNRWGNAEEVRPHKPAVEQPRLSIPAAPVFELVMAQRPLAG